MNMKDYLVPSGFGQAEFLEKRSRFIGHIWPADNVEEIQEILKETRERYRDATHNVYAYVIHADGMHRFSDDGEPGGSSGLPTLNVLTGEGISDVLCIVTRYFGGILLGRGGLSRAYSTAARLALNAAGISRMEPFKTLNIVCAYPHYDRVRRLLEHYDAAVEDSDFGTDVVVKAMLPPELVEDFSFRLAELSAGSAHADIIGECYRAKKL